MIKMRSGALALAFLLVLVLPGAVGAQDKFKKPAVSQNKAIFAGAYITGIREEHKGMAIPELTLLGKGFGTTQGTKVVVVQDDEVSDYIFWGDTGICFKFPIEPLRIIYHFFLWADGKRISNIYVHKFLYYCENLVPDKGPVGTEVKLTVYSLADIFTNNYKLKIGNYNMLPTLCVSGNYGKIVAKVPAGMSPGEYDVYLQKGSDVISNKMKFNVQYPPILLPERS